MTRALLYFWPQWTTGPLQLGPFEPAPAYRPKLPRVYVHSPFWPRHRLAELVTAHDVDRSYVRMQPGQAAFQVSRNDPQLTSDILRSGNLVVIVSEEQPVWAGYMVVNEDSLSQGSVEVSAIGLAAALQSRTTPPGEVYNSRIRSSAVFRQILNGANARGHTGLFVPGTTQLGNTVSSLDIGAQQALQALEDLSERSGDVWWLEIEADARHLTATILWGSGAGQDLSQHVHLWEGHHFTDLSFRQDLSQVLEAVTVVGGVGPVSEREVVTTQRETVPARRRLGGRIDESRSVRRDLPLLHREKVVIEPTTDDPEELARLGRLELAKEDGAITIGFTANRRASWRDLRVGNIITLHGSAAAHSFSARVRIVATQPSEQAGIIECVTETLI